MFEPHSRRLAPPQAPAFIESLRGVGYNPETAIADLLDNSISYSASNVWVNFEWNGPDSRLTLLDDGAGMSEEELFAAMQLGSKDPRAERAPGDLGRFGLGLKTASFSQCRVLTVASKRDGRISAFRWDLDYVESIAKDWIILAGSQNGSEQVLNLLDRVTSGTLVVWERLDRLVGPAPAQDRGAQNTFLEMIERVGFHVSMVFHRFLVGPSTPLKIFINGVAEENRVRPWDPFLDWHPATIRRPVAYLGSGESYAEVQAYILPHKDRLEEKVFAKAAGRDGWTAHQGFYIYRNRRLLVAGSWLGIGSGGRIWTKDEAYKLARIRLDISNASDFAWDIDIKKSRARPPDALKNRLRAVAADARETARSVFVHRGRYGTRQADPTLRNVWTNASGPGLTRYMIDREHPIVNRALATSEDARAVIEDMLRVIEKTVPVQRIWLDMNDDGSETGASPALSNAEIEPVLTGLWGYLRHTVGLEAVEARKRLLATEPFNSLPELVAAIITKLESGDQ